MQVIVEKEYPVAAGLGAAWKLLTDIPSLTSCMPGAQITQQIDATHYKGSVKVKVGPAVAAFAGDIELLSVDADTRTLRMLGKGADKGGSSASMQLTATLLSLTPSTCTLQGKADVIVNGKFAQFGGRMMTSVSDMILQQFAAAYSEKAQAAQAAEAPHAISPDAGAILAPAPAPASPITPSVPRELNALALIWGLIRSWFGGLFGRRT